jgi:hypothetical protein
MPRPGFCVDFQGFPKSSRFARRARDPAMPARLLGVEWRAGGIAMSKKTKDEARQAKAKVEASLDEALAETFPASDPPAMTEPASGAEIAPKRAKPRAPRK